jgi:hypothetical protein
MVCAHSLFATWARRCGESERSSDVAFTLVAELLLRHA